MARIAYLAVLSHDPEKLAEFYRQHVGWEELGRSPDGDITLTDGAMNFSLLRIRRELNEPRMEPGLHHIGISVDSIAAIEERFRRFNSRGVFLREPRGLQHGDARIYDPECNPVSLSENNFGLPQAKDKFPRIAHVAFGTLDPENVFNFYSQVFGFRELFVAHAENRKKATYKNRHVGDGHSNVAIQTFYSDAEGHEGRFGIAHMGVLVPDPTSFVETIKAAATIVQRPSSRVQAEIRMRDPEGNGCDISRRGWEVDTDRWVSAAEN